MPFLAYPFRPIYLYFMYNSNWFNYLDPKTGRLPLKAVKRLQAQEQQWGQE